MKETIQNYDRGIKSLIKKIQKASISNSNKEVILDFKDECIIQGLSIGRTLKYLYYLDVLASWYKSDFKKATKSSIKVLVSQIEQSHYANSTKKELKICIKKLYRWLKDTDDYPPEVKWIKPHNNRIERVRLPEEMLTEDDIKRLINVASKSRDKAFVSMLYESGCRISEIVFMKLMHVKFDQYGAVMMVQNGMKTGARRIRIVSSVPYLKEWLNNHPFNDDPKSYLWITSRNRVIGYSRIYYILATLGKKAGIKKKLNPHIFRHSRATYLANHLTEAQMKEFFGWTQSSDMASIYVHLSGRDVDKAVLKVYGVSKETKNEESILTPRTCNRCGDVNPGNNKYCAKCGMPLDEESMLSLLENDMKRKESDRIMDELLKDPEFRVMLTRKVKDLSHIHNKFETA